MKNKLNMALLGILVVSIMASTASTATAKTINWAGYTWDIVPTGQAWGHYWSDSVNNVWVDAQGRMHLKITKVGSNWYSSEIDMQESLGYGTYTFTVENNPYTLDDNTVAGFFYYLNDYNELDIEFSRWGAASPSNNVEYSVQGQPPHTSGLSYNLNSANTTHKMIWSVNKVRFESSIAGVGPWEYNNPPTQLGSVYCINLWLSGTAPKNGQEQELILSGFSYSPATNPTPTPTPTPTATPTPTPTPTPDPTPTPTPTPDPTPTPTPDPTSTPTPTPTPTATPTQTDTNLVVNPGFESGSTIPMNWTFVSQNGNTPIWDAVSHSGSKSIKISILRRTDTISGYPKSDLITVQPHINYIVSAWGKTIGAGGSNTPTVRVVELDANKNYLRQTNLPVFSRGTNDWTEKKLEFKTRSNARYIYVYTNIWNGYGTFWVDDVTVSLKT